MSGLPVFLTALLITDICKLDFVDADSCQLTYMTPDKDIHCKKTEGSLSDLNRTHLVLKYECEGTEEVYGNENCPPFPGAKFSFKTKDCALTPESFNFCNDYKIYKYEKSPDRVKDVVLRNGTFGNRHAVRYIYLSGNGIHSVESGAFGCLNEIYYLNMSRNAIEELPDDAFRCLSQLLQLDLSYNRLRVLSKWLGDLRSLVKLHLGDNWITVFSETALHESARIWLLDLDRNVIQKFCPSKISPLDRIRNLHLRGNNITSLTKECFAKQKSLELLDIGMNPGLVLANDIFAGMDKLEELYIDGCGLKIGVEGSRIFSDFNRLWKLHLQHNRLREIHSSLFQNLRNLEHLDLSFNAIFRLHNGSFARNYKLKYLDLSNNVLDEIKSGQFSGMQSGETLNISNNHITNVAEIAFSHLLNLKTLIIANNNISPMTVHSSVSMPAFKTIFRNLERLQTLDMSNVTSRDFNLSFSRKNTNIKYLDVSLNVGVRLDGNSLKNLKNLRSFISRGTNVEYLDELFTNNTELEEIDMSLNKFEKINLSNMDRAWNLRKLDLSWNNINEFWKDFRSTLIGFPKLEYLNLSHNALKEVDIFLYGNKVLKVLDVSSNRLASIERINFKSVDHIWATNNPIKELLLSDLATISVKTVKLEDCEIRYVHLHSKLQMENWANSGRTLIFMARNPVVCDCRAFQLYRYVKHHGVSGRFSFNGLTCGRPAELEGRKMDNLVPGDFSCDVRRSCPRMCRCLKRSHDHTVTVNCSRRDLGRLPEDIPVNTTVLDVRYNRITSLESLNSSIWQNLTEIHAEGNFISSLEFEVPKSVKIFLLRGNNLTKLPERYTAITPRDIQMTLSENPWPCGCESLHLKHFLSKHVAQIPDASEVRCAPSTNSTSNLTLLEMRDQDLCSKSEKVYMNVYIKESSKKSVYISLITFLSVLVFGLLFCLYYIKNDNFVKGVIYTHCKCLLNLPGCRKVVEGDKTFDCFISYGSEDAIVARAIVRAMGEDPNPEFKFCVHDRNWPGGSTISDNIFRSVELSRKTLIVVSPTFVKNRWFYLEFQAALLQMLKDRRERMIFVIKGDMPDFEALPRDVRYFLRTRTYLVWGEPWFMEKLRCSLQEESVPFRVQLREFLHVVVNCFRNNRIYHRDRHEEIV